MSIIQRDTFFKIFGSGTSEESPPIFMGNDIEPIIAFSRTFRFQTVIEIGVQRGETAKHILSNSPWIQRYIGIDLPPDSFTTLSLQQGELPKQAGELVLEDPRFELILKPQGTKDLKAIDLPEADFILIDGDHSKEGVLYDTDLARQVIRHGGIICWHDYGNSLVPDVTGVIDHLNQSENDQICLIENGFLCFQIFRKDEEEQKKPES